jgi:hypothetical protein
MKSGNATLTVLTPLKDFVSFLKLLNGQGNTNECEPKVFLFHDLRPDDVTLGFGEGREEPGANTVMSASHVQLAAKALPFTATSME